MGDLGKTIVWPGKAMNDRMQSYPKGAVSEEDTKDHF
jgi:hypothetical protein